MRNCIHKTYLLVCFFGCLLICLIFTPRHKWSLTYFTTKDGLHEPGSLTLPPGVKLSKYTGQYFWRISPKQQNILCTFFRHFRQPRDFKNNFQEELVCLNATIFTLIITVSRGSLSAMMCGTVVCEGVSRFWWECAMRPSTSIFCTRGRS